MDTLEIFDNDNPRHVKIVPAGESASTYMFYRMDDEEGGVLYTAQDVCNTLCNPYESDDFKKRMVLCIPVLSDEQLDRLASEMRGETLRIIQAINKTTAAMLKELMTDRPCISFAAFAPKPKTILPPPTDYSSSPALQAAAQVNNEMGREPLKPALRLYSPAVRTK